MKRLTRVTLAKCKCDVKYRPRATARNDPSAGVPAETRSSPRAGRRARGNAIDVQQPADLHGAERRGQWPELPGLECHSLRGAAASRRATVMASSPAGLMSAYGDIRKPVGCTSTGRTT